jgi:CubicO group peptidase (beta-lactamase class C family)
MLDGTAVTRIDKLFSGFTQPGQPGCALGVMQQGELAYARGYGLANLEHNVTITPSTVFYIASMSKQFTGLAIALLAEQGKLDLDADVRSVLPYVPDFGHLITPRHLLHHTSGLRSDIFLLLLSGWRLEDVIRQEDIVGFVKSQRELDFPPGSEFSYCGTGYSLLAELVKEAGGCPFPEFCERNIFAPLEMTHTRFELDPTALVPGRASPYLSVGEGVFKNAPLTIGLVGGTGVYTTIEDLALWDENFYTGNVGGLRALRAMQTPGSLSSGEPIPYAFGLIVEGYHGRRIVHHDGGAIGVNCSMLRFPEEHLTVAVLGNSSTVRASTLARSVADILLGIAQDESGATKQTADGPSAAVAPSAAHLESRSGRFFDPRSGGFVEIPFESGKLQIYGYELTATSQDAFFVTGHPEATVAYSASADGTLVATVDTGTGPTQYEKVEPVNPTPHELAEFAGTYHSSELGVAWRITLDGNALSVHRKRQGTSQLIPMCQDVFTDPWVGDMFHGKAQWVIAFDRENEKVIGLRVTAAGGRGRRLRFDKQA